MPSQPVLCKHHPSPQAGGQEMCSFTTWSHHHLHGVKGLDWIGLDWIFFFFFLKHSSLSCWQTVSNVCFYPVGDGNVWVSRITRVGLPPHDVGAPPPPPPTKIGVNFFLLHMQHILLFFFFFLFLFFCLSLCSLTPLPFKQLYFIFKGSLDLWWLLVATTCDVSRMASTSGSHAMDGLKEMEEGMEHWWKPLWMVQKKKWNEGAWEWKAVIYQTDLSSLLTDVPSLLIDVPSLLTDVPSLLTDVPSLLTDVLKEIWTEETSWAFFNKNRTKNIHTSIELKICAQQWN